MKIGHTSDLHLGRTMEEHSIAEDQKHILGQIVEACRVEKADVLLICGDIYDGKVPGQAAMNMLSEFLRNLAESHIKVIISPGNHDTAELIRVNDWSMKLSGIYNCGEYSGSIEPIIFEDDFGTVSFWPVPFTKMNNVKHYHPEAEIECPDDAFKFIVEECNIDTSERNVMMLHQNVLHRGEPPTTSGSEKSIIGNDEGISCNLFYDFDYVALGHIHMPIHRGKETIRYCGTPMIYDRSEIGQEKGMEFVELGPKGSVTVKHRILEPLRKVVQIEGEIGSLEQQAKIIGENTIVYVTLTAPATEPLARLNNILEGKNSEVFKIRFSYIDESGVDFREETDICTLSKDPVQILDELAVMIRDEPLTEEEKALFKEIVDEVDSREDSE